MYRIEWLPTALSELAQIWLSADSESRKEINRAAAELERLLHSNPSEIGESRPNDQRIVFAIPLGALYRIERFGSIVTVAHVWRITKE